MKRIAFMILRNLLIFPYFFFKMMYYGKTDKGTPEERYAFLKDIVKHANKSGNVTIECLGAENIPKENGFILFPNHQGMYDVLAIIDTLGHPFSVVAKKELENIPVLKWVLSAMNAQCIDRSDVRQSMKVIVEVIKRVSGGTNYIIFPEGTRSKNGNRVGLFKAGSFKSATKAKCPIVPVALVDSFKPFDTNTISQVSMKICYLEPLLYEEYKDMTTLEIATLVRTRVVSKIEELTGEVMEKSGVAENVFDENND